MAGLEPKHYALSGRGDVGTLVSVTTVMTVDTGSTSFSLLIPRVTLQNGQPDTSGPWGSRRCTA